MRLEGPDPTPTGPGDEWVFPLIDAPAERPDDGAVNVRRLLAVIGVAALAVGAVVASLVRDPVEAEPGTPEAAVQDFAAAVLAGDLETARGLVAAPAPDRLRCHPQPGIRLVLGDVSTTGDSALVGVTITGEAEPPFGSPYSWEDSFQLEKTAAGWKLVSWPWALCELELLPGGALR